MGFVKELGNFIFLKIRANLFAVIYTEVGGLSIGI